MSLYSVSAGHDDRKSSPCSCRNCDCNCNCNWNDAALSETVNWNSSLLAPLISACAAFWNGVRYEGRDRGMSAGSAAMVLHSLAAGCTYDGGLLFLSLSAARVADLALLEAGKLDCQIVLPDSLSSPVVEASLLHIVRLLQTAFWANKTEIAIMREKERDGSKSALMLPPSFRVPFFEPPFERSLPCKALCFHRLHTLLHHCRFAHQRPFKHDPG